MVALIGLSPDGTFFGNLSLSARGRNRQEGPVRRRGTAARGENRLLEQKLARSAHLPQKLANWVIDTRKGRIWGPANIWHPGSPIFFECCKIEHVLRNATTFPSHFGLRQPRQDGASKKSAKNSLGGRRRLEDFASGGLQRVIDELYAADDANGRR